MSDPDRLIIEGSEPQRALLARARAASLAPPPEVRVRVRLAVERRLFPAARGAAMRRVLLVLAGMLISGSALAYGVSWLRASRSDPRPTAPDPGHRLRRNLAPLHPAGQAPNQPDLAVVPASRPVRGPTRRRTVDSRQPPPPPAAPLGAPALAGPWDFGSSGPFDEEVIDARNPGPRPASPRLAIAREGRREISLVLAGQRVVGKIGDTLVTLTVERRRIVGKLGPLNVSLWLRGSDAEGTVGGLPIRFQLFETPAGHLLRQGNFLHRSLSADSARVQLGATALSWSPGCDAPLAKVGEDSYDGRCASGQRVRVVLPAGWQGLAILPRMILLSFFLPERAPELPHRATGSRAAWPGP